MQKAEITGHEPYMTELIKNDPELINRIKQWEELISKYGYEAIGKAYLDAHQDGDFFMNPEEFFISDGKDQVMQGLKKEFNEKLEAFYKKFLREHLHMFSNRAVSHTFARTYGLDIEPELFDRMITFLNN